MPVTTVASRFVPLVDQMSARTVTNRVIARSLPWLRGPSAWLSLDSRGHRQRCRLPHGDVGRGHGMAPRSPDL